VVEILKWWYIKQGTRTSQILWEVGWVVASEFASEFAEFGIGFDTLKYSTVAHSTHFDAVRNYKGRGGCGRGRGRGLGHSDMGDDGMCVAVT